MKDIRSILLPALKSALEIRTGRKVYDSDPIHLKGTIIFPHVAITDVYIEEDGPKNNFHYRANVLIEVNHKTLTSLSALYTDMDNILSLINNRSPFTLSGLTIMDCVLNNSTTTRASTDRELIDTGIIRLIFRIK